MPNSREFDHMVSNKFRVEIEGVTTATFTSLSGMESTTDVIQFNDGADLMTRKRPGRTNYSNLILKRGYINTEDLWQWYRAVQDGHVERKSGSIIALGDDGTEKLRYNFYEGWPCRWKSFSFDATKSESLFEEIEIAVERIEKG